MELSKQEYQQYVKKMSPPSPLGKDVFRAFWTGGLICVIGQLIQTGWQSAGLDKTAAGTATSATLVLIGALLTGFGLYCKIASYAGAGTLVPITGFSNSIAAPALEFKTEGYILGVGAKIFTIAGPVIMYGTVASVVYGVIYWVMQMI